MNLLLKNSKLKTRNSKLQITGSKSETNRLLLLQALYPNLVLENTSNSDDSEVMSKALENSQLATRYSQLIDVHHAGSAIRFLTAYFAIQDGIEVVLTGSNRMKDRPIKIIVEALNQLGAEITYLENEGFPPIRIKGKKITRNKISLSANVSSQYISALLLIAPKLENGLELTLKEEITSIPYIKMTLSLLNEIGVKTTFVGNKIKVCYAELVSASILTVESDWTSASYWYSIVALSEIGTKIILSSYKVNSLQGDIALVKIYQDFGVNTIFNDDNSITISKERMHSQLATHNWQLNEYPDIAQTIAVTCFGLGMGCDLFGLNTLKIKETDRLVALKNELTKLGATITVTNESLHLKQSIYINQNISIKTYQDHRMAMAFAPLALKTPIIIENAEVISKSYPTFWKDLKNYGFQYKKL
jgi:3-phosphoshikimate 1-carboxyvinyltransferase